MPYLAKRLGLIWQVLKRKRAVPFLTLSFVVLGGHVSSFVLFSRQLRYRKYQ